MVSETVACGACGAACTPEATFCWQCFSKKTATPRADPPPAPDPQPTMIDVKMGRAPLVSVSRNGKEAGKRGFLHIRYHGILKPTLMGISVLALIGAVGWTLLEQKITLPDEIAGMPRIAAADERADELARQIEEELRRPADAAVYATPRVAAMTVVSIAGSEPGGAKRMLLDIAAAEETNVFVRVDLIRVYENDGAHFACAPVIGAALPTACVWDDGDISGLVVTTHQRVPLARGLAVQAYQTMSA